MKTLINKWNPQIRITAPEIEVQEESEMYLIPVSDYCIPMCIDDWTLVDEDENISFADRLKERLENMTQEEFEKAMNEMYVDGDESPTLEEYLKAAYHSPIETEPVDLEKEIRKHTDLFHADIEYPLRLTAIKFYELGRKGGSK